jgi:hypothetical protein
LGSSPFARHYSGSRGFFPFLRLLRCFSSPACRLLPYGFRQGHTRITTCGFPHSEIPGSKVGQHLPRAYRSRPRPSSALGAKASTVCPSSLDHEEHLICRYGVFKVRVEPLLRSAVATILRNRDHSAPSKLSSMCDIEVDMFLGEPRVPTAIELPSRSWAPAGVRAPVSLERR